MGETEPVACLVRDSLLVGPGWGTNSAAITIEGFRALGSARGVIAVPVGAVLDLGVDVKVKSFVFTLAEALLDCLTLSVGSILVIRLCLVDSVVGFLELKGKAGAGVGLGHLLDGGVDFSCLLKTKGCVSNGFYITFILYKFGIKGPVSLYVR